MSHVCDVMGSNIPPPATPLRVLCLEDNPLIVMHLEQMIEDCGHVFVASLESFADLREQFGAMAVDCVLVDIDLADGRTGPDAASWLADRKVAALFVTGQEQLAQELRHLVVGIVPKPLSLRALKAGLDQITLRGAAK